MIHHRDNEQEWAAAFKIMNAGGKAEIDYSFYNEMLNVLPPRRFSSRKFETSEPHHHDDNGMPVYHQFWMEGFNKETRYFGALTTFKNQ